MGEDGDWDYIDADGDRGAELVADGTGASGLSAEMFGQQRSVSPGWPWSRTISPSLIASTSRVMRDQGRGLRAGWERRIAATASSGTAERQSKLTRLRQANFPIASSRSMSGKAGMGTTKGS